jgi:hypothetical protein
VTTVYRVSADGTRTQPLELVRSAGNGWHRYRILPPDPLAGAEFNTRDWYEWTTPLGACLEALAFSASRMRTVLECMDGPYSPFHNGDCRRYREILADVKAETRFHSAVLAQVQRIAGKHGLLSGPSVDNSNPAPQRAASDAARAELARIQGGEDVNP